MFRGISLGEKIFANNFLSAGINLSNKICPW